jgi:hypothetical protein
MNMPAGAKWVIKNWSDFQKALDKAEDNRQKAAETAVKVEMYRLKKALADDLKSGSAGGNKFSPLQVVSRGTNTKRKPLARLAAGVRYEVKSTGKDQTSYRVGFTGPQSSKSWLRIAHSAQDGGTISPDKKVFGSTIRKLWIKIGADYKKGRGKAIAKYFFLRKSTTQLVLPPRPIIDPFWEANQATSQRNIMSNFERKMKGERI